MYTLRQYLTTLEEPSGLCRTLEPFELCRDPQGRLLYAVGNSAAVFRIRREGRLQALRCYMRPAEHLEEIYGSRLLRRELFLYTSPDEGVWCDVVVDDWVEGRTLREEIDLALQAADLERLGALADRFDRLAVRLVADDWSHGDLKPENIVVRPSGELQLIDFDAMFLPAFAGRRSTELGTTAYQHPAREAGDFDASLDDYPAALISTALHALALDPSLAARHASDGLLFTPSRMGRDGVLEEVLSLFELRGMAVAYRIARLLCSPTLRLFGLERLLRLAVTRADREGRTGGAETGGAATEGAAGAGKVTETGETAGSAPGEVPSPAVEAARTDTGAERAVGMAGEEPEPGEKTEPGEEPELFVENGLWGYRCNGREVIPPLYDCGFDFSEGLAAVRLGHTWHYIDRSGRTRLSLPGCEAVKPFRGGRARIFRDGTCRTIDPEGCECGE